MNRLPRWLHHQTVQLGSRPSQVLQGGPIRPASLPTRAERALALRSLVLFEGKSAGDVQSPDWVRQLAAISMNSVSTAVPRLIAMGDEPTLHNGCAPIQLGSLVVAHNAKKGKSSMAHCEARIIKRLRHEPAALLEELSPLVFYSVLFPCPACADAISRFACERPAVRIELAFEDVWRDDDYGSQLAASQAALRSAGLEFVSIRDLVAEARQARAAAHLLPEDKKPASRRKPRATTPEEIAAIRAERAAKRALCATSVDASQAVGSGEAASGTTRVSTAANYNARQWMKFLGEERMQPRAPAARAPSKPHRPERSERLVRRHPTGTGIGDEEHDMHTDK